MVQYTNPELTDMVLIYGEALSNADATRRLYFVCRYMKRFPGRQVPCPRTVGSTEFRTPICTSLKKKYLV
jgi:hypothetical protein